MASFATPMVHVNPEGWGPTTDNVPEEFKNVPFAYFGKGDRLGRAADFTSSAYSSRYRKTPTKTHTRADARAVL